jgi:hypothetical protein
MSNMRFQHFQIPETAKADWLNLCGDNAYAIVNANRIPAPLSTGLLQKCDTALVLRSGSLANGDDLVYIMANLNRVHGANIDQMPFAIGIISGSNFTSGALTHHGNYDPARTSPASPTTQSYVTLTPDQQARFVNNFSFYQLPPAESGPLASLGVQSQINALNTVVAELQAQIPITPVAPASRLRRGRRLILNWLRKLMRR